MTPVDLDISDQADSVYFKYTKSADSHTHTFLAKDGFAIKNIKVTDKKNNRFEHLWGSPSPVSNAYKVIAHSSGPNANYVQIHLLNNAVTSVYSATFSSSREETSLEESVIVKEGKEKHPDEKQDSADTSTKATVNYKLLYILLPTVIGAVGLVIAAVAVFVYRRKRENSSNLLSSETSV
ncbi:hypothetical protein MACJ_000979 [Theileria orientalis]|uniref:Uncharacterized protein n=1 Tax=Theileria orientalis TaxID=68886 RepID=A0A976M506_THEOR|nr:hypothetical protein MACJ_000979 [Theileria orientalis]